MTSCNIQKRRFNYSTLSFMLRKAGIMSVRSGLPQTYSLRYRDLVAILMNQSQKSGISWVLSQCLPRYYID